MSIRVKMILIVAGTLILAMLVTAFFIRRLVFENILRNKMTTVDILTASLVHDIKTSFDLRDHEDPSALIAKYTTYYRIIQQITYYDTDLVSAAASDPERVGQRTTDPDVVAAISRAKPTLKVTRRDWANLGIRSTAPILKGSRIVGAIDLEVSMKDIQLTLSAIDRRILLILVVAVALSSIILFVLLRRTVLTRLTSLMSVTQHIAGGNYDIRVEDDREDELGELAQALNRMTSDLQKSAQKIDKYNKQLEEMVRDATHQLQKAYEDLKNAQSQLVLNEKMASLGVLIAGVAHEINTPVGSILNVARHLEKKIASFPATLAAFKAEADSCASDVVACLEDVIKASSGRRSASYQETRELERVLREHGVRDASDKARVLAKLNFTDGERVKRHIAHFNSPSVFSLLESCGSIAQAAQISETSSQKIMEIVRALKFYAYSDETKVEMVEINESIQTALVLLRNRLTDSVNVVTDLEAGLPAVPCTSEIHQVWTNLLTNSLDAVSEMGEGHAGEISLCTRRSGDDVVVTVADNGVGIPQAVLDKVFDPFFTTKEIGKGTGLGLCIVSGIIKKRGGDVRVSSRRGETIFQVVLPVTGLSKEVAENGSKEASPTAPIGSPAPVPSGAIPGSEEP